MFKFSVLRVGVKMLHNTLVEELKNIETE